MPRAKFLLPSREKKPMRLLPWESGWREWGQGAPRAREASRPSAWAEGAGRLPDVLQPSVVSDAAGRSSSRDNGTAGTVPEYQSWRSGLVPRRCPLSPRGSPARHLSLVEPISSPLSLRCLLPPAWVQPDSCCACVSGALSSSPPASHTSS